MYLRRRPKKPYQMNPDELYEYRILEGEAQERFFEDLGITDPSEEDYEAWDRYSESLEWDQF